MPHWSASDAWGRLTPWAGQRPLSCDLRQRDAPRVPGPMPMDRNASCLGPRDILLVPLFKANVFGVGGQEVSTLGTHPVPLRSRLVVMGPRSGAGCRGHTFGPHRFAWNLGEVGETWVFEWRP